MVGTQLTTQQHPLIVSPDYVLAVSAVLGFDVFFCKNTPLLPHQGRTSVTVGARVLARGRQRKMDTPKLVEGREGGAGAAAGGATPPPPQPLPVATVCRQLRSAYSALRCLHHHHGPVTVPVPGASGFDVSGPRVPLPVTVLGSEWRVPGPAKATCSRWVWYRWWREGIPSGLLQPRCLWLGSAADGVPLPPVVSRVGSNPECWTFPRSLGMGWCPV